MFGGHINGDSPRAIHQLSRYLPRVARFEYVMHADYARIESDGVLSVLGGNFRTRTALLNTASVLTIVGRLVLHPDETGALLAISLSDPAGRQLAQISGTAPRPVDVPAGPDGARSPELSIDADASAAYLRLSDAPIVRTLRVAPRVNVDVDEMMVAVGIELLTLGAPYPVEDIIRDAHVRSEDHALVRGLLAGDLAQFTVQNYPSRSAVVPAAGKMVSR